MTQTVVPPAQADTAQAFLQAFAQRYGNAYLRLAYHAAFPLSLTSDLLYRLWGTLCQDDTDADDPIPYGAVAKLLVGTGLCQTVGSNLYQIDTDLRQALLHALEADPRFGASRLQDLAAFTLSYAEQQKHHPDPMVQDFAQVQRWGALAYCQTPQAAQELAQAIAHAYDVDRDDLYRMAKIVLTLADPLKDYPTLLSYARGMERLACGDEAGAREHLKDLLQSKQLPTIEGITLPLPALQPYPVPPTSSAQSAPPLNWVVWRRLGVSLLTAIVLVGVGSVLVQRMMEAWNSVVADNSPTPESPNTPFPSPSPNPPTTPRPTTSPSPSPTSPVPSKPGAIASPPTSGQSRSVTPPSSPTTTSPLPPPVSSTNRPTPIEAGTETPEGTSSPGDEPVTPVTPNPGESGSSGTTNGTIPIPYQSGQLGEESTSTAIPPPSNSPESLPPTFPSALAILRESLQRGDFRHADEQTNDLLLAIGDTDRKGYLAPQDVGKESFCDAIQAIDYEWVNVSNGRFGFSVQTRIWREVGKPPLLRDDQVTLDQWGEFAERVGWRRSGEWINDDELTRAPSLIGSLPRVFTNGEFDVDRPLDTPERRGSLEYSQRRMEQANVIGIFFQENLFWYSLVVPSIFENCSISQF